MAVGKKSIHGEWSSRWAFIMAATGSAVGLGNIWRFSYMVGEHGGAAFILVYLLCIAVVGVPVMMSEIMLGRRGRMSPINTMQSLAEEIGARRAWRMLGWVGVIAGFLILSFYSVVGGWSLAYVPLSASGAFAGADADAVSETFEGLLASPGLLVLWHTVFLAFTVFVVSRGVEGGLEKAVRILMPALVALLLVMVGYGMASEGFAESVSFLFAPDFSAMRMESVLVALGQAFFTLSLGMGAIMVYGSYLSSRSSVPGNTGLIAGADTLIAVLAGLAVFPVLFAVGLDPEEAGPGLVFVTLSAGFGQMPAGALFGTLFFVLLSFAAWTSAISIIEPATAYLVENRDWSRGVAAVAVGAAAWLLGIGSALSFNLWADWQVAGMTFMGLMEFVSTTVLLPLGGLFIAVFAGWILPRRISQQELAFGSEVSYLVWRLVMRYFVPVAVAVILVYGLVDVLG